MFKVNISELEFCLCSIATDQYFNLTVSPGHCQETI